MELYQSYIFWWIAQVVAVAILLWFLLRRRWGFLHGRTVGDVLRQVLDARAGQIQAQLEAAQQSREEAARIHEQAAHDIEQARQDSEEIVARAAQTSQAIQKEMEQRAHEEYERIVGQARSEIEYERQRAELELQRRAADIVVDAARQVVERNLDAQADQQLIGASLSELRKI